MDREEDLQHYGVRGMKWKKKKTSAEQMDDIDKGRLNQLYNHLDAEVARRYPAKKKTSAEQLAETKQIVDQISYQNQRSYSEELAAKRERKKRISAKLDSLFEREKKKRISAKLDSLFEKAKTKSANNQSNNRSKTKNRKATR